ncbi:MAG: pyridoxamine 5'-phosphate oxidase family protein [Anaerovoracaceae bacterium]
MRRKDREMSPEFGLQVIENCQYGTLATVNQDGRPYCIPVSPVVSEGVIYFHSAAAGHKVENLMGCQDVCLSAVGQTQLVPEEFTTKFESGVVFGKCHQVLDEAEKIEALRCICEKYAHSNMKGFQDAITRSLGRTAVFKIEIDQVTGKAKK